MNTSFELLSSMSPKICNKHKSFKKAPTILALKKYFRKSLVLDNSKNCTKNKSVISIGSSSSNSSNSSVQHKKLNETPIVISDSEASCRADNTPKKPLNLEKNKDFTPEKSTRLSKEKFLKVEQWINEVNNANKNVSLYSEVSTVYGDDNPTFKQPHTNVAASSTVLEPFERRFDQFFKKKSNAKKSDNLQTSLKKSHNQDSNKSSRDSDSSVLEKCSSSEKSVLDDSLYEDAVSNPQNNVENVLIDDSFKINLDESFNTRVKKKELCKDADLKNLELKLPQTDEYEELLDSLYGDSWREKKDEILPVSEPRPKKNTEVIKKVLNTEKRSRKNDFNKSINTGSEKNGILSPVKLDFDENPGGHERAVTPANDNKRLKNKARNDLLTGGKNEILPLSESKPQKNADILKKTPNMEKRFQKTDFDKYIKTDDSNLLKNLQKARFKRALESPWAKSLRKLCDSDSETESRENGILSPLMLDFDEHPEDYEQRLNPSEDNEKLKNKHKNVLISANRKTENRIYSFLESLSGSTPIDKCDVSALIFRKHFNQHKDALTAKLFELYNEKVFENLLPENIVLEWNDRMRGTAGTCVCKKITRRTGAIERTAKIVLAKKVLDSADRLRDTLIHELCHAATWIVNGVADGHGSFWKSWACQAMKVFPELPPIKRCHNYVINTKYTYRCQGCGYSIGRHTKSLDTEKKCCGYCRGTFEVLINKTSKKGETKSVPATPKKPNEFALFVKDHYANYKTPVLKHGDVMKILGQKFSEMKVNKT